MIATLLRIGWITFKRDRVVKALTFAVPIVFFSIFATVFSNQRDVTRRIKIAVVDEDQSAFSQKLVAALKKEGALSVRTASGDDQEGPALDRAGAEALVKAGTVPVAVVLPKGLGVSPQLWPDGSASGNRPSPKVALLSDVSDPIAPQVVQGLLQKVSFTAAPEVMATEGIAMFERYTGPLTPAQRQSFDRWSKSIAPGGSDPNATASPRSLSTMGLATEVVDVMQKDSRKSNTISFFAAGVGVMFLLFTCAGAGGALLEEEESGTLGRLVSSRAGMSGVLLGKWLFIALMGMAQMAIMFSWGAVVFGLPLFSHLPGFLIMTAVTAAAAAGFGLVLATLSRTRAQLSGLGTIVILSMSALGGSMFPRFLMSDTMQQAGLLTFNAWALDGYLKVFWRDAPLVQLWPQVLVLASLALIFLAAARLFARRWESA
ncbi:MAG TPA: ABC transporter permease [Vicinamibacterales bacterium]|nr:ABC transporter permease [Vicinamibacterales bacterium]